MSNNKSTFYNAFSGFIKLLRLEKKDISTVYVFSVFSGILFLALPFGIQSIVGFVIAGKLTTSIIVLIISVILALFINGLLQIKQLEFIEKIEQKIFVRYALAYSETLPQLNLEKLDNYNLPELVNRFFDVSSLQKSIYKLLLDVPAAIMQIVIGTIVLSFYHPFFIGFGLLLLSLVGLIIWQTSYRGLATSIATSNFKYDIGAWLEEIADNIKSFKFNKSNQFHIQKTDKILSEYLISKTAHFKVLKIQYWSVIAFKIIITAIMLILGVNLLINQQINIGQFIAADIVIISIISSVEKFISNFDILYDALTSIQKLDKVTMAEKERSGSIQLSAEKLPLKIEFKDVQFSYSNAFPVLNRFTAIIHPGEWVQIVGNKSVGKSSIFNLLSGAYQNYRGQILINGLPLGNYDVHSLRENIGFLLQQSNIFKATLLENIAFSHTIHDMPYLMNLVQHTGLINMIRNKYEGLDLIIDPQNKRLTPSDIQAILLTRALYKNTGLLLLEDPFLYMEQVEITKLVHYIKSELKATVIVINNVTSSNISFDKNIHIQ